MIVVSDTSAITSLIQVRRCEILAQLFSTVVIPPAVHAELLQFHSTLPTFLVERIVLDRALVAEWARQVDLGEAEAMVLAKELKADFLLMDDLAGRELAAEKNLPVIGLLGVIVRAKQQGFLSSVGPVIAELESVAGFRISSELKRQVLAAVQE